MILSDRPDLFRLQQLSAGLPDIFLKKGIFCKYQLYAPKAYCLYFEQSYQKSSHHFVSKNAKISIFFFHPGHIFDGYMQEMYSCSNILYIRCQIFWTACMYHDSQIFFIESPSILMTVNRLEHKYGMFLACYIFDVCTAIPVRYASVVSLPPLLDKKTRICSVCILHGNCYGSCCGKL